MSAPPPWLVALHAAVGQALRAPLSGSDGRLRAPSSSREPLRGLVQPDPGPSVDERLAFVQHQVWMRLLHTAQEAWPRCVRALGPWAFNLAAHEALQAHPPRGHDLGETVDVIGPHLLRGLADDDGLLRDAVRFDAATRAAARTPWSAVRPRPVDATPELRLAPGDGFHLLRERFDVATWPLRSEDSPAPALPAARWWVVAPAREGLTTRCLDPVHARLLAALLSAPLERAVITAARGLNPREADHLHQHLAAWLREAVDEGWLRPKPR